MQMYRNSDLPQIQMEHTYRTPPWAMLLLPLIMMAICIAMGWALVNKHLPGLFWVSLVILAPLSLVIVAVSFLPALRPTNWVVKVRGDRLYVMLRNYRNRHLPTDGPVIASFEMREIESVGEQKKEMSAPGTSKGKRTVWSERSLELRLKDPVPEEFHLALECERSRKPPETGRVRAANYYPSPISIDGRTIHIRWKGQHDALRPSLVRALEVLGGQVPVHGVEVLDRRNPEQLSDQEFDVLILDLCQSGKSIAAAKLLRERRGYSLTEAKKFIDELAQ